MGWNLFHCWNPLKINHILNPFWFCFNMLLTDELLKSCKNVQCFILQLQRVTLLEQWIQIWKCVNISARHIICTWFWLWNSVRWGNKHCYHSHKISYVFSELCEEIHRHCFRLGKDWEESSVIEIWSGHEIILIWVTVIVWNRNPWERRKCSVTEAQTTLLLRPLHSTLQSPASGFKHQM